MKAFPLDDFRILHTEFGCVSDQVVIAVATSVEGFVPGGAPCKSKQSLLWMLATCHALRLRGKANEGEEHSGPISSASVGSVSLGFSVPASRGELGHWFSLSPYGQQFLALRRTCAGLPRYLSGSPASRPWR